MATNMASLVSAHMPFLLKLSIPTVECLITKTTDSFHISSTFLSVSGKRKTRFYSSVHTENTVQYHSCPLRLAFVVKVLLIRTNLVFKGFLTSESPDKRKSKKYFLTELKLDINNVTAVLIALLQQLLLFFWLQSAVCDYHDPAAAGQCSCVPLRLQSSEMFAPAGPPCSPPPPDSETTPPPDRRMHEEEDCSYLLQVSRDHVPVCFLVPPYLPVTSSHGAEKWSDTLLVSLLHSCPLIQQEPADRQTATSCCCCQS